MQAHDHGRWRGLSTDRLARAADRAVTHARNAALALPVGLHLKDLKSIVISLQWEINTLRAASESICIQISYACLQMFIYFPDVAAIWLWMLHCTKTF